MYKLWNKLFGWDYVYWEQTEGFWDISRIRKNADGVPYFISYCGKHNIVDSRMKKCILFLTCSSDKYLKGE